MSPQLGHRRRLAILASGKSRPRVQTSVSMLNSASNRHGSILTMSRWSPRWHRIRMPHPAVYACPKVLKAPMRTIQEQNLTPLSMRDSTFGPGSFRVWAMDKLEVARRQLGTALHLFVHDLDPVSVHTLASAACVILETLATIEGKEPFSAHAFATFPDMTAKEFYNLQRKHFNAFKHMTAHVGGLRDDEALLESFSDRLNDGSLFVGWYDSGHISGMLPIAAQVFQAWYFATRPGSLTEGYDAQRYEEIFPGITAVSRQEQKRQLRDAVQHWESDQNLLADKMTDPRPLVLPVW